MNIPKTALYAAVLVGYCTSPLAQTAAEEKQPEKRFSEDQIRNVVKRLMGQKESWLPAASGESIEVFVEVDSIRKSGRYTKVWTLRVLPNPVRMQSGRWTQSTRYLEYIDCLEDSSAWKQLIAYSDDIGYGEVVDSSTLEPGEMKFRENSPGTIGSSLVKFVCKLAARQKKK